ncbi:MAG: RluA family pseudouridine synthase [Isosphaeraceae bacterium]
MRLDVLYEDNHCLAVNKPAGVLSQGDETGDPSLIGLAADYLKEKYRKPGNVFVGLVHRLDRPTSGVVLLARTSKAAGRLSEQFRTGRVRKVYWAVVEGCPEPPDGSWEDLLDKDRTSNRVRVLEPSEDQGRIARVDYEMVERGGEWSLIALRPKTGRSHQLRVQLSSRGLPIVGDRKYGASSALRAEDGGYRIALHARELTFHHPTRDEDVALVAPLPADWPALGRGRVEGRHRGEGGEG